MLNLTDLFWLYLSIVEKLVQSLSLVYRNSNNCQNICTVLDRIELNSDLLQNQRPGFYI